MHHSHRLLIFTILLLFINGVATAQLPVCSSTGGTMIYYLTNGIWQYNPGLPVSATNPVQNTIPLPPSGGGGLAVSNNLNGPGPSPTFYTVGGNTGTYMYWDGTTWVNSGHSHSAVNPCGAGPYIYTLNGGSGQIYRYDGTGPDVLVLTVASFASGGPYDLAGDNCGNFYVLRMNNTPSAPYLNKYDPAGNLIQSWTVSGQTPTISGGGMGIIGNTVYCHNSSGFWIGTIGATNVTFTLLPGAPTISPSDFGTCALGATGGSVKASIDTGYYCLTGSAPIPVNTVGAAPINVTWSVLSGNATILGSGPAVNIVATTTSRIVMEATAVDPCGGPNPITGKDTVHIIVPTATLEAGNNKTIFGCGSYEDTLLASLTNHIPWLQYNLAWTPTSNILGGGNTLKPTINPQADMWFKITATTNANQGSCTWADSVRVTLTDAEVTAAFGYKILMGCEEDTLVLLDSAKSKLGALKYYWNLNDNGAFDTTKTPIHIYKKQNLYQITQLVSNEHCKDTLVRTVDLNHPLEALFTFSDKICEGDSIDFDGSPSIISLPRIPEKYEWYFGGGARDSAIKVRYAFPDAGIYSVMLVVTDSLNCTDTMVHTVDNIRPLPYVEAGPHDTVMCKGEKLYLPLGISARGDRWEWNDGSQEPRKVVSKNGTYIVRLHNECGFGADTVNVSFNDCTIFFPNAFSPNGDGKNDLAKIIGNIHDVTDCEMIIFNRWGERVYYSMNKNDGWDGTYKGEPQSTGTYYYIVKYKTHGEPYELKGDIILVR